MTRREVILDRKLVPGETISLEAHRYVGMWRPPPPEVGECYAFVCNCGRDLFNRSTILAHYLGGCLDVPQYESIRPVEKIAAPEPVTFVEGGTSAPVKILYCCPEHYRAVIAGEIAPIKECVYCLRAQP